MNRIDLALTVIAKSDVLHQPGLARPDNVREQLSLEVRVCMKYL